MVGIAAHYRQQLDKQLMEINVCCDGIVVVFKANYKTSKNLKYNIGKGADPPVPDT